MKKVFIKLAMIHLITTVNNCFCVNIYRDWKNNLYKSVQKNKINLIANFWEFSGSNRQISVTVPGKVVNNNASLKIM